MAAYNEQLFSNLEPIHPPQQQQQQQCAAPAYAAPRQHDVAVANAPPHRTQHPTNQYFALSPQQPQYAAARPVVEARPGFLDRMFFRRRDFVKLLTLALIIVLALAVHGAVKYALSIHAESLSSGQVLSVKIVYVLVAMLLLWIMKTANV